MARMEQHKHPITVNHTQGMVTLHAHLFRQFNKPTSTPKQTIHETRKCTCGSGTPVVEEDRVKSIVRDNLKREASQNIDNSLEDAMEASYNPKLRPEATSLP